MLSFEKFHLAVIGAHAVLGAELARLAVALGHDVSGFGPEAQAPQVYREEPWVQGVTWCHDDDLDALHACDRLALCVMPLPQTPTHEVPKRVAHLLELFEGDVIVVAPPSVMDSGSWLALMQRHASHAGRAVRMSPAEVLWMPDYHELPQGVLDVSSTQRVETVAMAALRVMLEDERTGVLDRAQIAHLGDAMMLQ